MRVLFSLAHPAHFHLFRHAMAKLRERGHVVYVAVVTREELVSLLTAAGVEHEVYGVTRASLASKVVTLPAKEACLARIARRFRPDIFVSTGSPYAAHVATLTRRPHLAFGDTERATVVTRLMLPFTRAVCTPACFGRYLGPKHVKYNGYHEIAYLRPPYFSPDPECVRALGLQPGTYTVVRLSAWDSSHDVGVRGLGLSSEEEAVRFLDALAGYGTVVLSTELPIGHGLARYRHDLPPDRMHQLLAHARLYVGEGATMASEAGVLGVPWVYASSSGRGYLDEQSGTHGLGVRVVGSRAALEAAERLLDESRDPRVWRAKADRLRSQTIDVTAFIADFIEHWPDSPRLARCGHWEGVRPASAWERDGA